jgi:hypothetical protein
MIAPTTPCPFVLQGECLVILQSMTCCPPSSVDLGSPACNLLPLVFNPLAPQNPHRATGRHCSHNPHGMTLCLLLLPCQKAMIPFLQKSPCWPFWHLQQHSSKTKQKRKGKHASDCHLHLPQQLANISWTGFCANRACSSCCATWRTCWFLTRYKRCL